MSVVDTSQCHSNLDNSVAPKLSRKQTLYDFTRKGLGNVFIKKTLSLLDAQNYQYQQNLKTIDKNHTDLSSIDKVKQWQNQLKLAEDEGRFAYTNLPILTYGYLS